MANHKHNITENSIVRCYGYEGPVRDVHTEGRLEGFLTVRLPTGPTVVHHSMVTLLEHFDVEADKAYRINCLKILIQQAHKNGSSRLAELEAKLVELAR